MSLPDFSTLDEQARTILRRNDRGGYTVPTDRLYPHQWNWDSAFTALGIACYDIDRAWTELETLLSGQWDNGMVPHILFHRPSTDYFPGPEVWNTNGPIASSGISQLPIATMAVRALYTANPSAGRARAAALLPRLHRWHCWFLDRRMEEGAIVTTHPWESGRDNAPDWDVPLAAIAPGKLDPFERRDTAHVDPAMRPSDAQYECYMWLIALGRKAHWDEAALRQTSPFRVLDPGLTFALLRAHRDLKALAEELGVATPEAAREIATLEAGARALWNPTIGAFDAKDSRSGQWAGALSNASFLAWFAGVDEPRLLPRLDESLAAAPFGLASHDPSSPRFDPKRYWRGPSWAVINFAVALGLHEHADPRAHTLRMITREMIARSGFAEYYDPLTCEAAGGGNFSWTAAVWLVWASPNAKGWPWVR